LDLDLGSNELADQVRLELRADGGRLELLEAVRQLEGLRVEEREFLLHRDGEVGRRLEPLPGERDLLVPAETLVVAHAPTVLEGVPALETGERKERIAAGPLAPARVRAAPEVEGEEKRGALLVVQIGRAHV